MRTYRDSTESPLRGEDVRSAASNRRSLRSDVSALWAWHVGPRGTAKLASFAILTACCASSAFWGWVGLLPAVLLGSGATNLVLNRIWLP